MSMDRENHPVFDALHIPPTALEQGGVEVLRAAVVEGGVGHVCRPSRVSQVMQSMQQSA